MNGLDPYSGSRRLVKVTRDDAHVLLEVEDGAALLTPHQVDALREDLENMASAAAADFDQEDLS